MLMILTWVNGIAEAQIVICMYTRIPDTVSKIKNLSCSALRFLLSFFTETFNRPPVRMLVYT